MLYNARNNVIKLFDDYSKIASKIKYKVIHREKMYILTPKPMFQRFPTALAQVEAGNATEKLVNEIRQRKCSLFYTKEFNKTVYNNIVNLIQI